MLRRTSKRVKEVVDKMRLPAVVRLSRSFWDDTHNGTKEAKLQFVLRQLAAMTVRCLITTLALPKCEMMGQDVERVAGVLAQCPALTHLDLSDNSNFGAAWAESLAEVLVQCRGLVHLNLCGNFIGAGGVECLAKVLGQCRMLVHLNLLGNLIGPGGAESLAGVLAQCTALAHLDVRVNDIGTVGEGRLRASWRGQASRLLL
jgi:Ran GTPase-activating protein (RanGAP) involved in mRNA processing and transport